MDQTRATVVIGRLITATRIVVPPMSRHGGRHRGARPRRGLQRIDKVRARIAQTAP